MAAAWKVGSVKNQKIKIQNKSIQYFQMTKMFSIQMGLKRKQYDCTTYETLKNLFYLNFLHPINVSENKVSNLGWHQGYQPEKIITWLKTNPFSLIFLRVTRLFRWFSCVLLFYFEELLSRPANLLKNFWDRKTKKN